MLNVSVLIGITIAGAVIGVASVTVAIVFALRATRLHTLHARMRESACDDVALWKERGTEPTYHPRTRRSPVMR